MVESLLETLNDGIKGNVNVESGDWRVRLLKREGLLNCAWYACVGVS